MGNHDLNIDHYTLICALKDNQEQALRQLFDLYSDRVYAIAYRILKDQYESEDLVQEVFVKMWNVRFQLDEKGNIWSFLYVITKRLSLNKLRDSYLRMGRSSSLEGYEPSHTNSSDDRLAAHEIQSLEHEVLQRLPVQQKTAYLLSRVEGLSHKEIADQMNLAPNTVKNHIVQALKTFREHFEKSGYPTFLFFLFFG